MAKILFIDDNKGIVQNFVDHSRECFSGHEVVAFSNALEAIKHIEKSSPADLLITDMALGGSVGGEHIAQKVLETNCVAKIFVASSLGIEGMALTVDRMRDKFNLSSEQVTGLKKPYRIKDFIQKVENFLDGHNETCSTNELGRQVDAILKGEDDSGSAFDLLMGS